MGTNGKQINKIFDVCIIGTGPAGIITALEYARLNNGKQLLLIEYGDKALKSTNALDDSIVVDNKINHHTPYEATNKGFGGTSQTWGGRCVMYDRIDFEDRPVLKDGCTWNVSLYNDLLKYLPAAANYFECGEAVFNLNDIPQFKSTHIAENFVNGIITDAVIERWSMPTRFGKRYANEIAEAGNITLLQGFEARDFLEPDSAGNVSELTIRNIHTGETITVSALKFVLAAGAQESTRILLRNQQLFKALPHPPAALGKYYQGHLSGKIASIKFYGDPRKTDYGFIRDDTGVYLRRRFQLSNDYIKQNNLLNIAFWLDNPHYYNPSHKSGAMSFMYLAMITPVIGKKLAPPAIAQSVTKGKVGQINKHLLNIVKQLPGSLYKPASIFYKRYLLKRKLPGVFLYSPENKYALHFHSEQQPVAANNLQLKDDGETLVINYELQDDDINEVIRSHKILDDYLRKCNCGELVYWFKADELFDAIKQMSKDGIHQSGTTRIAKNVELGVVNNDLKLLGTENIFVCSSSVFPTSGQANPTFLLGTFAVRLAHYLTN